MTLDLAHTILGLGGHALLLAAAAAWLARGARPARRAIAAAGGALLAAAPIGGLSVAAYLRGTLGDLSVMTLLLLGRAMLRPLAPRVVGRDDAGGLWPGIAAIAVVFYPTTLGLTGWDPYALGFRPRGLVLAVAALALAALPAAPATARLVALSMIAFDLGLAESSNLWDYLLDPILALYALGRTLGGWLLHGRRRDPAIVITEGRTPC